MVTRLVVVTIFNSREISNLYFVHIGKDPDAGKERGQEENRMTEDEMAGWHHRLNAHEFEQALGVGGGQGSLACCSPWWCKESDMTE